MDGNIKTRQKPKARCSWQCFSPIDSFAMFKNRSLVQLTKQSKDRICLMIPRYDLIATYQDDNNLHVRFRDGFYIIPVEQKTCNFGGFYYFFHCPVCTARMRKLYCIQGKYLCRKCGNLAYYSQRLRPAERHIIMGLRVKTTLEHRGGSLEKRPPRMQKHTFHKFRRKYVAYDEKYFDALNQDPDEFYFPPSNMLDAHSYI